VPAGADTPEGSYEHEDGISFITEEKLTFTQAAEYSAKINALALIPVLE